MKIVDLSIRRRVTIAMFTIAVLLFGSVSLSRLKINLLPDLSYPTLTIRTEYAGAAPAEIENLVTKPVEEAVGVVKNVRQVRSISRTGQSDVVLEFVWGTDMDYASLDVREKLDALLLPLETKRPVLLRFDPSLEPIMRFGLYRAPETPLFADAAAGGLATRSGDGPLLSEAVRDVGSSDAVLPQQDALRYLRRFADEQVKKEFEGALGVAAAKISGGLEDEVQVFVDQSLLAQLSVPIEQIVRVLRSENVNLSGGRLEEGSRQYLVRTLNQFQTVSEIGNVVVSHDRGVPIYLRDVATIRMGHSEREAITRIDGVEAVEVAVYKEGDANTVAVARAVEARLERINSILPDGMKLVKVYDQSTFITSAVDEVVSAGLLGGLLAVLILYFFLRDFASTFVISLAIPVSVIATFNLMYGFDLTLNIMSLGGLALGIGLLVDNGIVVLENIARHRGLGKDRAAAARDGASEVGRAVVASTLTTIAVFFPLVFVHGIAGQLFRDQALTVTFALIASLVVALTVIPMLATFGDGRREPEEDPVLTPPRTKVGRGLRAARLLIFTRIPFFIARAVRAIARFVGRSVKLLLSPFVWAFNRGYDLVADPYPRAVGWALRHKAVVLLVAFGLFAASLMLIPRLGIELIPQLSQGEFHVEIRLPPGTPLERTDAILARAQQRMAADENIQLSFAVAGTGNRMDANPDEGGENWGQVHVALKGDRSEVGERKAVEILRRELAQVPGVEYKFGRPTLFTFATPIEIEVAGYDLDQLKNVAGDLARRLENSDRFADVKSTLQGGHPEVQIHFDRERAAALGLPVYEVAERVVSQVRGDIATRYTWNDRRIDVLVRAQETDRASVDHLRRLIVNPGSSRPVPLEAIANVVVDVGPGEIRRINQQRVAVVTANLRHGDLGAAVEEIGTFIGQTPTPPGISIRTTGQSEEMASGFRSLLLALALAIFLVYLVMASQFESLVHPFVIFFTIPLALIGAILALWVTGSTVSVVVFIGLILLAGIVVNNAIILLDLVNQLREQGRKKYDALVEAGRLRLRPILMTTLTTTLGLLPLAIGFGDGSELRAPMAITVIGGLLVSTMLTLIVIPVMYAVVDRKPDAA